MRAAAFPIFFFALAAGLPASEPAPQPGTTTAAAAPLLFRDDQVDPQAYAVMVEAQAEAVRLRFDHARELAAKGMAMAPGNPLGMIIDAGVRLYELQEDAEAKKVRDGRSMQDFLRRLEELVALSSAQEAAFPKAPWPKLHLGGAYGCRGLVNLYLKNYWTAYWDGKKGVDYLKQSVKLDKEQHNAYMGLGQFNYYAGSMGSVLQFLLFMHGDVELGLKQLETAAEKGSYAAWSARIFLAKVLITEVKDWARAEPYLRQVLTEYPESYHHWRYAMTWARGLGLNSAKAREVMEALAQRWDAGWRAPAYAEFAFEPTRLDLAKAYMDYGDAPKALPHLKALAKSRNSGIASEAQKLMAGL